MYWNLIYQLFAAKGKCAAEPWPRGYKLFQCSTQLSTKFTLLINVVEIDHEIISAVILLPSADSFKKGCYQLQAKVCARTTGKPLVHACHGKGVAR